MDAVKSQGKTDAEAVLEKGEVDIEMERARLGKLRAAQIGAMTANELKPMSLKGLPWKEAKHALYLEDTKAAIVELADKQAVVINGNTSNAVHAVTAGGILQTLKVKRMPFKILQPLLHAEWEEMIRSVVGVVDADNEAGMIEFLTGTTFNKADFGLVHTSGWKREVLIVQEFSAPYRQPLLEDKAVEFTTEQLEDIGKICAADLLFNNQDMLAEQIGLVQTPDGEKVTSMAQCINAEPDGIGRTKYMGMVEDFLENVFDASRTPVALADMRSGFWWGNAELNDEQMGHVLKGMRTGLQNMAKNKAWTKESLAKLVNKTFRSVNEDVGMSSWDEIMEFLHEVQEQIEEAVDGKTTIVGMFGVKSFISTGTDFD